MRKTLALIAILLGLSLAACGGKKIQPQPQVGEVHFLNVEWQIVDRAELERAYTNLVGKKLEPGQKIVGFAAKTQDGRDVIVTLPPRYVDDTATCTLGHEILHVTHGSYHE